MKEALKIAKEAVILGEVPIGAVIVESDTGKVITTAINQVERNKNPLCHAEMVAIYEACKILGTKFLVGYEIYVTLEPCSMCATAISLARLDALYFGAYDVKTGGVEHGAKIFKVNATHHKPEIVGGIMEDECKKLMTDFFKNLR